MEDTRNFLCRLSYLQDIPENVILISSDAVGLYSNILHEEGIDIMRKFLNERSDKPISTGKHRKFMQIS